MDQHNRNSFLSHAVLRCDCLHLEDSHFTSKSTTYSNLLAPMIGIWTGVKAQSLKT